MNVAGSSAPSGLESVVDDPSAKPATEPLTFLVVDDERHMRLIVEHMLKRLGHHVLLAKDAEEAFQVWEAHPKQIHVVITDVNLPNGVSGFALAKEFGKRDPHVALGFVSGFASALNDIGVDLKEGVNYLPKPFTIAKLVKWAQTLPTLPRDAALQPSPA